MLKLLQYALIACVALFSTNLYAESVITCPQTIKCVGNFACHLPAGFMHWKVYSPVEKSSGRYNFYQSVYVKYSDNTTVTCRYGNNKGPYIILDHANHYQPLLEKNAQWIKRDDYRHICNAAFPKHCSFHAD